MKYFFLITLYILCFCQKVNNGLLPFWIVWNVGQGQWVSYVDSFTCYHFDAGGEFFDDKKFKKHCQDKYNVFSFSHWDWDHINLTRKLKRLVLYSCLLYPPNGPTNIYKERFLSALYPCKKNTSMPLTVYSPRGSIKTSNNWSRVFLNYRVIIPGDGSKKTDKKWLHLLKQLPLNKTTHYLVLAHHGSKTGTSKELLQFMKKGSTAISSARRKRYGHPHPFIQKLLKIHSVNLISTEDFGHIYFQ